MDATMSIVAVVVVAAILIGVLYAMCKAQGQSPWWSLLGAFGLIGFGIAAIVLYAWKPRKPEVDGNIRGMYARGEITEEEYRLAMTGKDRAA